MEDLAYCVRYLAEERFGAKKARETASSLGGGDERALFEAYRALVNVREPMPAADEFLAAQDRMLRARIAEMGIVDARALPRAPLDGRLSQSIAFCCIGTGVFGFPQKEAAEIAVRTARRWLDGNGPGTHVVFDVFLESDERIYRDILFG